jgi:hypothetical protein
MYLSSQNQEQLKLLSIFHYIVAGILVLFFCPFLIEFAVGCTLFMVGFTSNGPLTGGLTMLIFASVFLLFGWGSAFCIFRAGKRLPQYRDYTFCKVVAGVTCIFLPFGTILGIFTLVVLARPEVKQAFAMRAQMPPWQPYIHS